MDSQAKEAPATPTPVDLADLNTAEACNKAYRLELLHPKTRAKLGVFISVLGRDSDVFQAYIKEKQNDALRKQANAQRRNKDLPAPTVEEAEADACEALAAVTTGWENVVLGGEALAFNVPNAIRLYTEQVWIRRQVDEAVADLENFM